MAVFLFPLSELALSFFRRASARGARGADEGSLGYLWATISCSVTLAATMAGFFPALRFPVSPITRDLLALALLVSGLVLRWSSIVILGRFFTVDVAIHADHSVVEAGPYRYVRHPSYTGVLMAFLGVGVYFGSWLSLLVVVVPIALAFGRRMDTEERALTKVLGPTYEAYCARTRRLIPGLY